jgi:hypothetical protein
MPGLDTRKAAQFGQVMSLSPKRSIRQLGVCLPQALNPRLVIAGRFGVAGCRHPGITADMPRLILALLSSTFVYLLAAAWGLTIPADPENTLERVTGSTMRIGVSPNPPWTDISGSGEPKGTEADLVREFAETLQAQAEWVIGGEEALIAALERGELQLVIAG